MAEGLLGGLLADDKDKPEVEAPEALADAKAFAAAVAARLSASDPEAARDASRFLKQQTALLHTQSKQLEEEHTLRLTHLRDQAELLHRQRFGQALGTAFQVFFALVATVLGLGGATMIREPLTSHRVMVDPFHAPLPLEVRRIDGDVVASGLLARHDEAPQYAPNWQQLKDARGAAAKTKS